MTKPTATKGVLIAIEGPDGIGKSTVIAGVKERIARTGATVRVCREPGETEIGKEIRAILLKTDGRTMDGKTATLLFSASRRELLVQIVNPALQRGEVVILDRFFASTFVYQTEQGVSEADISAITDMVLEGVMPVRTIVLTADQNVIKARRALREGAQDAFDAAQDVAEISTRRTTKFLELARRWRDKGFRVVDASGNVEENIEAVCEQLGAVVPGLKKKPQIARALS